MAYNKNAPTQEQRDQWKQEKEERLNALAQKLDEGIKGFRDSDKFKDYLKFVSKFHNYSPTNTLLIFMQCPQASLVKGGAKWKEDNNRFINKGEKAIQIYRPVFATVKINPNLFSPDQMEQFKKGEAFLLTHENKDGRKWVQRIDPNSMSPSERSKIEMGMTVEHKYIDSFTTAPVYDVSQTHGDPVPQLTEELKGQVKDYDTVIKALEDISAKGEIMQKAIMSATHKPASEVPLVSVPISFEDITKTGAKGYYSPNENKIVVQQGMPEAQTVKTMIHEIAHSVLHNKDRIEALDGIEKPDRHQKEVEAEAIAFMVADSLGLDTSDYSFPYITSWSDTDRDNFEASMAVIKGTSMDIISDLSSALEKSKDIEKGVEKPAGEPEKWTPKEQPKEQTKEKDDIGMNP